MNLKQMIAFNELMLTGSVSEAARNLNRTQPTVSHQIASLEDSLGMQLFERRNGRLHAVPEAQYLFEECSELLQRIETLSQNMRRMKAKTRGELRVVSMPGPSVFFLPELIAQQFGSHPDIRSTLLTRSSEAVLKLVSSQQYDLGIADHEPTAHAKTALVRARAFRFECHCAVPSADSLARRSCITPNDLDGRPMALLFPEHVSHQRTMRTFEASGCALNVRFVTQYFIPLLTYVERGLACSIVDPLTMEAYRLYRGNHQDIAFRPFEPLIDFTVAILTPKHRPASLLANAFIDRLVEVFGTLGASEMPAAEG